MGLFDGLFGGGGLLGGYGTPTDSVQLAFNGDPASIRFNNPGAQYPGPSALAFGTTGTETIGGGHKIAVFPDPESGAAAQFDLLNRGYSGMTLGDAIRKWSGGNSSPQYISSVSKATGISPSTVLTPEILQSPEFAVPLAKAMARQEAGRDFPMSDEQWQAALARANGGSPIASGRPPGLPSQAPELPGGAGMSIPAMAQPAQGQMPPSRLPVGNAAPPAGLPQPQAMNPLLAGFLGFANSRSPMGALGNLIGGLATGHRTDEVGYGREQEQQAQLATYQAAIDAGIPKAQAALLALNPGGFKAIQPQFHTLTDALGNQTPVFVNPITQKITNATGNGNPALDNSLLAKGVTQEDTSITDPAAYLAQYSPEVQAAVKNYIEGNSMPTGNPRKGWTQKIKQIAQNWGQLSGVQVSDAAFTEKRNLRNQLGSAAPASMGGQLDLANTSLGHLGDAAEAAVGVKSKDYLGGYAPGASHLINAVGNQATTSNAAAVENLKVKADRYGKESTKLYAGSPGSARERVGKAEQLGNPNLTPLEQASILEGERDLLAEKIAQNQAHIDKTLGPGQRQGLTDVGQRGLEKIDNAIAVLKGKAAAQAPQAAAKEQSSTPTIKSKAEYDKLPKGATFIGEDGKPYRKP